MCAMLNEEGKSKWYCITEQLAAGGNFEGVVCKSHNSLICLVHVIESFLSFKSLFLDCDQKAK
jgi:hypothetical protein